MADPVELVRIVLVSPGDVAKEREAAQAIVDELNQTLASAYGSVLALWRWETDAYPAMHLSGPQGTIDRLMDIEHADVVVGVFWKRFGTPTAQSGSGTEHELRRAWSAWKRGGTPQVMVYFSNRGYTPKTSNETQQWGQVLDFQRELPREQLWWTYVRPREFRNLFRRHLTQYLLERWIPVRSRRGPPPDEKAADANYDRIDVEVDDRPGVLAQLAEILGLQGAVIQSSTRYAAPDGATRWVLLLEPMEHREGLDAAVELMAAREYVRAPPHVVRATSSPTR